MPLRCGQTGSKVALDGTEVTDAGLVHLAGLTKLKELDLDGTQVVDFQDFCFR